MNNPADFYYGYLKNHHVCSCGRHYGCGEWTPPQRAAIAKRMFDRLPSIMQPETLAFLTDWEKHHGFVHYRMDVVGKSTGSYDKSKKGEDVIGAVFIDAQASVRSDDIFQQRVDIHG
jgi:hypothetical protein